MDRAITMRGMCTWQEERRLTDNLTLHYKRVMYIVEPTEQAHAARGKRVLVVESNDGEVRIEYRGIVPQDYNPDRIVFRLDATGTITQIDCG